MNTRFPLLVLSVIAPAASALAGPRDAQWRAVDEAAGKGLPQTALERLEPIIAGALADRAWPEAIDAIGRKIALEGSIQGNKPEERIVRLQAELDKAPPEMRPMMEAILARWYRQFFQQNRWRFWQRARTAEPSGEDILTWDLARILGEIDRHFSAALADEAALKATPIATFDALLEPGSAPDRYRPTMFDFVAYEALQFHQAGEQAATSGEEEFELEAASPIFADAEEFVAWRPDAADESSATLEAVHLFQKLLTFHQADEDRSAFLDADLARLAFGVNFAVGDDTEERYRAALQRFIEANAGHEISAGALALLARRVRDGGDPARAHALARRGLEAFPQSAGGALCFNLIHEVEAKSAQLRTERVWNAPWPTLDLTYRNIGRVYFRAVRADFDSFVAQVRWNFDFDGDDAQERFLGAKPALEWSAELPATPDFKERTEKLPAPTTLKPGFYFIVASHDPAFGEGDNQMSFAPVWVSDLALVIQTRHGDETQAGLVLNAVTGEPVGGATLRFWVADDDGRFGEATATRTDEDGRFEFSAARERVAILAEHRGHAVSSTSAMYFGRAGRDEGATTECIFFTDRTLYRPGQAIDYKGIAIRHEAGAGRYATLAGREIVVAFNDPNGKEIARATHRTNDYGSFSGTFTAPRDRLTGRMSIAVVEGEGRAWFNVEEYKRPKFEVELPAPAEAARLGQPVRLVGNAAAYTGAAVDGAKVSWRVERQVQMPYWCWWFRPPASKAIAHGSAVTEADGTFRIEFRAAPDRSVPEENEPVFAFSIDVDVTDSTGETRSAERAVLAGYTALRASLDAAEWQTPEKPVEFSIATASLDGDPQAASGTLTIHALKQPRAVAREPLRRESDWWRSAGDEPEFDPANPDAWESGGMIAEKRFETDASGKTRLSVPLGAGIYRASLETTDRFGRKVTARRTLQVVDPRARRYGVKLASHFSTPSWSVAPGQTFSALWGTGYESGRAFVEIACDGKLLRRFWTTRGRTQALLEIPVTESMRGGFSISVTYVRENRLYVVERIVEVPWTNKRLAVKWGTFRSKLAPGQRETWTAIVTGADAKRAAAEMVATLYDASLDQFQRHDWPQGFEVFRSEAGWRNAQFQNASVDFEDVSSWVAPSHRSVDWSYRKFRRGVVDEMKSFGFPDARGYAASAAGGAGDEEVVELSPFEVSADEGMGYYATETLAGARMRTELRDVASAISVVNEQSGPGDAAAGADLSRVAARRNLNETAFFFPHLLTDANGEVKLEFTMPEALTRWRFLGFAHDQKLRAGLLAGTAVTAKDLMVQPNAPRFVREGDAIEFTVKVTNLTDQPQSGRVRLAFADAATLATADEALGNRTPERDFEVPARESRSYAWRIAIPDGAGFLTYKAVGASAQASDGEEGFLPVLSRRVLVSESLPLPVCGPGTREFAFDKLLASGASDTLRHQSLTVQMVSQPAWYAVMSLPYLMEFPYECSEQVFHRLYANALARHIANADPKIRRVFDRWKATPALDSPLEKNQELKSVMLEETPWLREAAEESRARRNVGLLFDASRLDEETARLSRTLAERQLGDGLWSWFPGGRPSESISLVIVSGFGRLRHLGAEIDAAPALKALVALDAWTSERVRHIVNRDEYVPEHLDANYLYARSFFLKDRPVAKEHQEAVDFLLGQARRFWLRTDCRQCQAQLAIALQRFGDTETPLAILRSLRERAVNDPELGMFWRDQETGWWWYRAPIETQAMTIEAFDEVAHDAQAVEDCKVWLLKQKQTQDWRTTTATADAIYALLLRGENLLASDALVEVALGGESVRPENVEAGTGFFERRFVRDEIHPEMGRITVTKTDEGVSWGGVHWQYLEDVAKVTPHEATPLRLKKTLFVKQTTAQGQVLEPVTGALAVGDELVVRLELRTDRDMEFVHLKDQRGSGTEPVDVLSGYRFRDGVACYESTRDTASHFFIDYLPKGTFVFEYAVRVQLRGSYQSGIAEVQCMYAPEFSSHSASFTLEVK